MNASTFSTSALLRLAAHYGWDNPSAKNPGMLKNFVNSHLEIENRYRHSYWLEMPLKNHINLYPEKSIDEILKENSQRLLTENSALHKVRYFPEFDRE